MKILCATPAYGNQVSANYMMSFLNTSAKASESGHEMGLILLGNYSHVSDARNFCASTALKDGWDRLFFIDADQAWHWSQAELLLKSERFLIGGTYPLKRRPIELNFIPLERDAHYFLSAKEGEMLRSESNFKDWAASEADEEGEAPVEGLPGGFLLISRLVLEKLAPSLPSYTDNTTGGRQQCWEFFRNTVSRSGGRLTEDYSFSALAAEAGFQPYLQVNSVISHEGYYTFKPEGALL